MNERVLLLRFQLLGVPQLPGSGRSHFSQRFCRLQPGVAGMSERVAELLRLDSSRHLRQQGMTRLT